ncbi:hypothetical protein Tsubulata_033807 [Turnera subulata]|uniref:Ricin B lectin domain-containing protein n=1 Tax=Turnera subulata TaxID=218843 RepID=A0A9Q0FY75_9ROSI|nr:hypothetical protein Tsubulata_033807 [Turnera subulata]
MMMKLSMDVAWVCLVLVLVVWAPLRISGVELLQEDPKLSASFLAQPPMLIQQVVGSAGPGQQIRGPKGLCIDVYNREYKDGAELILFPCKSKSSPDVDNQLWTFKELDGTIRINNNSYCLMPNSSCPVSSNYLTISKCPDDPSGSSAQWSYYRNSQEYILHLRTGLVLTAKSDVQNQFGALTVDVDRGLPGQGWVLDDGPSVKLLESRATIGRCLTVGSDGYSVGMGGCLNSSRNNWEIIAFSSIANNGKCLSCQDMGGRAIPCKEGSRIAARDCCVGMANQRWMQWDQGHFFNPESGLFLTLADSGDHLIAAPAGNPSNLQIAQLMPPETTYHYTPAFHITWSTIHKLVPPVVLLLLQNWPETENAPTQWQ